MAPSDSISLRRMLYELREVTVPLPGGGRIGPISWMLERGRRVRVATASDAQWQAFVALLTGEQHAATGTLEEVATVTVQTDTHLRESLNLNRSLEEYLNSPDMPELIMLDGRRRSLWVLLDVLGISPHMTRRALKYAAPELIDKVWALRFMLSRASLLIGRDLFRLTDEGIHAALRRRWSDLTGAVVVGETEQPLPGPVQEWVRFDGDGGFTSGREAGADDATGRPPGDAEPDDA